MELFNSAEPLQLLMCYSARGKELDKLIHACGRLQRWAKTECLDHLERGVILEWVGQGCLHGRLVLVVGGGRDWD